MRRAAFLALLAATALAAPARAQVVQREPWRPPAFEPSPLCDVWIGTGTGNDPSKLLEIQICGRGEKVTGRYQTSSRESGYSVREIAGQWNADRSELFLRETKMTIDKPNPGWRFCAADWYKLRPGARAGTMLGSYASDDCHDYGDLTLTLDHVKAVVTESTVRRKEGAGHVEPPRAFHLRHAGCSAGGAPEERAPIALLFAAIVTAFAGTRRARARRSPRAAR